MNFDLKWGVLFKIVLNLISAQNNSAILKEVFDKNTKKTTQIHH